MALETWLLKVKKSLTNSLTTMTSSSSSSSSPKMKMKPCKNVGILAFEISGLMSKLIHLWNSLSDDNLIRIRNDCMRMEGVRKIVSNDEAFLLDLACAEMVENLRLVAKAVSRLSIKCEDSNLRDFDRLLDEFSNTGRVRINWVFSLKEMEAKIKKMDYYIVLTTNLHREIDELLVLENGYKKSLHLKEKEKMLEHQQKILWQRQQIKYLKDKSLWCKSFDTTASLMGRCIFTVLSRIKHVFGINHRYPNSNSLSRSLSTPATVYPSMNQDSCNFVSGPLIKIQDFQEHRKSFFESYTEILESPAGTLGGSALAIHYANLITVLDKMIKTPQLVGEDARNDLYSMLPISIRSSLRSRLKGVGFFAGDPVLAGEWRGALHKILGWLSPLAHNMIKWQSERSIEQQELMPKTNVLLLQTLYFANQEKTEGAITELLVGLNYIWRFEKAMNAKVFACYNLSTLMDS